MLAHGDIENNKRKAQGRCQATTPDMVLIVSSKKEAKAPMLAHGDIENNKRKAQGRCQATTPDMVHIVSRK
jgi:hypothetical protein